MARVIIALAVLLGILFMVYRAQEQNMGSAFPEGATDPVVSGGEGGENISYVPRDEVITEEPQPTSELDLPNINPEDIPRGFTLKQLSPYFHKVRIAQVSRASTDPDSYAEATLVPYIGEGISVRVSGWRLQSNRGSTTVIPKAVEFFSPYGSTSGSDLVFRDGQVIRIYSSTSIAGQNFQINKCVGYLEENTDFLPSLPGNCPDEIKRENLAGFKGECQDYIFSLGACQEPDLNADGVFSDPVCRSYLQGLRRSYVGCYERHSADPDFLTGEWRLWVGSQYLQIDERHDRVLLFDINSLLVDEYVY